MKTLIINSSPRIDGNSDLIEKFVEEKLKIKKIDFKVLKLRDINMSLPDDCFDCAVGNFCKNTDDDMEKKIIPMITKYDRWLIITPTICGHSSALFKIFIDRLSSLYHDDRVGFFKNLELKAIIHGQVNQSWKPLICWFEDFKEWTGLKSFKYIGFASSPKKGFNLPKEKITSFIS